MISKKRGCLGIFILLLIFFIILVVMVSKEETELADKISVLAKNPENLDSLQKYCLEYKKTFSKVLDNCNNALAPIIAAEEAAKEQAKIEQKQKDSLAKEQVKRDSLIELARNDSLATEQMKKDSLAIEQERKDSLLKEVTYKYNKIFDPEGGKNNFNSLYCEDYMLTKIKSLIEQGANARTADTLLLTEVLVELEGNKKDMAAQFQLVKKYGENLQRLERAYNIDLKEINEKIKKCKEIKKVLVKNLKIN